jgi:hypothetical protein
MIREPFQVKPMKSYKMIAGNGQKDTKYLEHNQKPLLKLLEDARGGKTKVRCFDEDMRERYRV